MIEVQRIGGFWVWTLICAAGRVLAYSTEPFETSDAANAAAKRYRAALWAVADLIDNRQARCF